MADLRRCRALAADDYLITALAPRLSGSQMLRFVLAKGMMELRKSGGEAWSRVGPVRDRSRLVTLRLHGLEEFLELAKEAVLARTMLAPSPSELFRGLIEIGTKSMLQRDFAERIRSRER